MFPYKEFHMNAHPNLSQKVEPQLYGPKPSANDFLSMFGHWIYMSRIAHVEKGKKVFL